MVQRDLIERMSGPAPRYTSYPTAPHFQAGVTGADYGAWLAALPVGTSVSLYIHVPFCRQLCRFCACTTKATRRYDPIPPYLDAVLREAELVAAHLRPGVAVRSVHWGGGTPSMLAPADIARLAEGLRERLPYRRATEFAVEIDPREVDGARLDAFAAAGLTRASLGVQDFDPAVQAAIGREQSEDMTRATIDGLRARGVDAVNVDLVYGLPRQTRDGLRRTLRAVIAMALSRIALFGYAHVPWMKRYQRLVPTDDLPGPVERFAMANLAASLLSNEGYERIGLDHFARFDDPLAIASREGRLRRNFQGYVDDPTDALIGLGASAIGTLPGGHAQNEPATGMYRRAVEDGRLPVARGRALTLEDRVRGDLIERLMCDFAVDLSALARRHPGAKSLVGSLLADAAHLVRHDPDDLVSLDGSTLRATARGQPFIRHVASAFDAYLGAGQARHSTAV